MYNMSIKVERLRVWLLAHRHLIAHKSYRGHWAHLRAHIYILLCDIDRKLSQGSQREGLSHTGLKYPLSFGGE